MIFDCPPNFAVQQAKQDVACVHNIEVKNPTKDIARRVLIYRDSSYLWKAQKPKSEYAKFATRKRSKALMARVMRNNA